MLLGYVDIKISVFKFLSLCRVELVYLVHKALLDPA